MLEDIFISALVTLIIGFPLSAYASIIVVRFGDYNSNLNQARSLILKMEQNWEYNYLDKAIPDTDSRTGRRTVFMSKEISNGNTSWQLMQIGLNMKELGHWTAATAIDSVWLEIDDLREQFIENAELLAINRDFSLISYIADWHRTLSRQRPSWSRIFKPWPNQRYKHLSCVEVDETTGEFRECTPSREHEGKTTANSSSD